MKKVVLKTALVTIASLILGTIVFCICICSFAPGLVSNFYFDAGNDKLALHFMQKEYERNPNDRNLKLVTERAIWAEDATSVKKYSMQLLKKIQDGEITVSEGYVYYIAGEYCESLYNEGSKSLAISVAVTYSSGYGNLNPLQKLMVIGIDGEDKQFLGELSTALKNYSDTHGSKLSIEARDRLKKDRDNLTKYLNN